MEDEQNPHCWTGPAQEDAVRYCRDAGHDVYAVAYRRESFALELFDHFEEMTSSTKKQWWGMRGRSRWTLRTPAGPGIAMPTNGLVSKELEVPCYVSEATADQGRFPRFQRHRDLARTGSAEAGYLDELQDWDERPAVIKPVDSRGQRGVFEIADADNLCPTQA